MCVGQRLVSSVFYGHSPPHVRAGSPTGSENLLNTLASLLGAGEEQHMYASHVLRLQVGVHGHLELHGF